VAAQGLAQPAEGLHGALCGPPRAQAQRRRFAVGPVRARFQLLRPQWPPRVLRLVRCAVFVFQPGFVGGSRFVGQGLSEKRDKGTFRNSIFRKEAVVEIEQAGRGFRPGARV
jgi:hypothetical protein